VATLNWQFLCVGVLLAVGFGCAPPAAPPPTPPPQTAATPAAAAIATLQSSPAATALVLAAATSVSASPVQISAVRLDTVNFGDWSVTLSNVSQQPVDLAGWTLFVGDYLATLPANEYMTVLPDKSKVIHLSGTSVGNNPAEGDNIYIGSSSIRTGGPGVLTNNGQRVVLVNPQNQVASVYQLP
jgi:hypothetical protein